MKLSLKVTGFILPIVVSVGLLVLIYKETDPVLIYRELSSANLLWAVSYFLLSALEPLLRGIRWSLLAVPVARNNAIKGLYIAKAGNNIFPLRIGDAIRAQYIRDKDGIPYSVAAASVLAESFLDLLLLSLIVLLFGVSIASGKGILLSFLILISLSIVILLLFKGKVLIPDRLRDTGPICLLRSIAIRLKGIVFARSKFTIFAFTALLWLVTLLSSYCGLRIFLPSVSVLGVVSLIAFVYFSVLMPSAPGFVGTYHAAVAGSLAVMGYSINEYPVIPIAVHLLQYIPQTAIGLLLGVKYLFSNDWRSSWKGFSLSRRRLFKKESVE